MPPIASSEPASTPTASRRCQPSGVPGRPAARAIATVESSLDGADEEAAAQRADADDQQQRGAAAGEQHLAAARRERLGALVEREAQAQHGDRAAAAVERSGWTSSARAARAARSAPCAGCRASTGRIVASVRSGWTPLRRTARARRRAGSRRSRGLERLGEAAGERGRLGLAGPAVRVGDRRDRAVREEAAAGEHERRGGGEQPGLQPDADKAVARGGAAAIGHARSYIGSSPRVLKPIERPARQLDCRGSLTRRPLRTIVRSRMRTRIVVIAAAVGLLLLVAAGAVYAYDHAHAEEIGKGVRVGGVDVSGLTEAEARAKLERAVLDPLKEPVTVRAIGKRFTLTPARAQVDVDIDGSVRAALDRTRDGNMLSRTWRGLRGEPVDARARARHPLLQGRGRAPRVPRRQGGRQARRRRRRRPGERRPDAAGRPRTAAGSRPSAWSTRSSGGCSPPARSRP